MKKKKKGGGGVLLGELLVSSLPMNSLRMWLLRISSQTNKQIGGRETKKGGEGGGGGGGCAYKYITPIMNASPLTVIPLLNDPENSAERK